MTMTLRIDSPKVLAGAVLMAALAAVLMAALVLTMQSPQVPGVIDMTRPAVLDVGTQVGPVDALDNESQTSNTSASSSGTFDAPRSVVNHEVGGGGSGTGGTVINKIKKGATHSIVQTGAITQGHQTDSSTSKADTSDNSVNDNSTDNSTDSVGTVGDISDLVEVIPVLPTGIL